MADLIEGRVREAVDAWLRWLPRWTIGTARGRTRVCRTCFGSPVATAAGFDHEVPHAVQHALLSRLRGVVDDEVDVYTTRNLPLVDRELRRAAHPGGQGYQPQEGLAPEFQGLDLDPEPEPGQPFLFTLAGLAGMPPDDGLVPPDPSVAGGEPAEPTTEPDVGADSFDIADLDGWLLPPDSATPLAALPPDAPGPVTRSEHQPEPAPRAESEPQAEYSDEAKAALRHEITLAGDHAEAVGTSLCLALVQHRPRIAEAIDRLVAPQVDELLAELSRALEQPRSR